MAQLTNKERLKRAAKGQEVDRIPALGGWMLGVANLAALGGITNEQFLRDPLAGTIRANLALGVDGMIRPTVPLALEQIRTGLVQEEKFEGIKPEAILERAQTIPDSDAEILRSFDQAAEEAQYRAYFEDAFRLWGGIEPVPNFWEIGGHFPLYTEYGYMAFWEACALYPEAVGRIWHAKSLHSRERAKILCGLYREFDLVPLMFCGEDLANNKGPLVSPKFLRQWYLPTVRMIIEPLLDLGVRFIHHCDGDIRPLLQDYINVGFSGFQGFQYELGIEIADLRQLRSLQGEELLFFTGLSVSRTLPLGTPEDVRAEVDYFVDSTAGGRGMFLITSNVSGVEVPPENLEAGYRHVKTRRWGEVSAERRTSWPWALSHAM